MKTFATKQSAPLLLLRALIAALLLASSAAKQYRCRQILDGDKVKQVCQHICVDECPNGFCDVSQEKCVCKVGAHLEGKKCVLDCETGCPEHAECISGTSKCRCKAGYRESKDGKCLPSCSPDCGPTQYCAEPNTCRCKEGYLATAAATACEPLCPKGCGEHGRCVAPNKCQCEAGYQSSGGGNGDGPFKCQPVCDLMASQCQNADCVSPGVCQCRTGYVRHAPSGKCEPSCQFGCGEHGICIGPDRCDCMPGYHHVGACEPKCDGGCAANEYCYQPNVCRCVYGYEKQPSTGADGCMPNCLQGCDAFAYCVAPEKCKCYAGYAKQADGSCKPICRRRCSGNSTCVAPEICLCKDGFAELKGACVPEEQAVAASITSNHTCLKEMNLLVVQMHVSCETGPFVIYLVYGVLVGLLLAFVLVSYKGYHYFRRSCRKKQLNPAPADYVITYQPSTDLADMDSAGTSRESAPPSYNSLPRKY